MPLIRRRPLLRAAAIGGGAYHFGKRRQEAEERLRRLEQLGELHEQRVLSDDEFAEQKAKLLNG
jgi:hypothetical protein